MGFYPYLIKCFIVIADVFWLRLFKKIMVLYETFVEGNSKRIYSASPLQVSSLRKLYLVSKSLGKCLKFLNPLRNYRELSQHFQRKLRRISSILQALAMQEKEFH